MEDNNFIQLRTYRNRDAYRQKDSQIMWVNKNFIIKISLINADTHNKNSEELLQVKMFDDSTFVVPLKDTTLAEALQI